MMARLFTLLIVSVVFMWSTEAVQPDDDLQLKLSHIKDNSEFCEFMGMDANCTDVLEEEIPYDENGDKMAVSGSQHSKLALFDACNPREQTVALPRHPDSDITIWPFCTRAMRCGGCCTSDVFSCEPTATKERFVKIFETRLPYKGAQRFTFLGVRAVKIIEHLHCDAQCKTKPHECHRFQMYEERKCRCTCRPERLKLKETCHRGQIWDDTECDCICPNRATAVCPEPSYFNTKTCKCTLKIGVNGEMDIDRLFADFGSGRFSPDVFINRQHDNEFQPDYGYERLDDTTDVTTTTEELPATETTTTTTTPATTTTTTQPTTTTKATTPKPCPPCRGVWRAVRLSNGRCTCLPPRRKFGKFP